MFAYEVKRAALGNYIEQTWGWNEQFQQRFHADDWANHPPDIIELDGNPIGTLEVLEHTDHLFIGEFYIPNKKEQAIDRGRRYRWRGWRGQ